MLRQWLLLFHPLSHPLFEGFQMMIYTFFSKEHRIEFRGKPTNILFYRFLVPLTILSVDNCFIDLVLYQSFHSTHSADVHL